MCGRQIVGLNGLGFNLEDVPSTALVYRSRIGTDGPRVTASGTHTRLFDVGKACIHGRNACTTAPLALSRAIAYLYNGGCVSCR